jgi:hypothetical protein
MPRFKVKGVLERNALGDLWKHTLSRIPTTCGRLVYLTSLRDPNSGAYRHHGITSVFGREEGLKALRESHEQVFLEWIGLTMQEKYEDLGQYLAEIDEPLSDVVDHWLRSKVYRTHVPSSARDLERELFCSDLEALLLTIKNAAGAPARASSRRG